MQHQESSNQHSSLVRHIIGFLLGTTIVACLASMSPGPVLAQQPHAAAPSPKAPPKQMTLRNVSRDTMKLELRVGAAPDCSTNPLVATQLLPPGKRWLIATPRPVCWRRVDARASAGAKSWHRHLLKAGEEVKLALTN